MELPRKGLGRGIASLIPIKREPPPLPDEKAVLMIPVSEVVRNPQQPRKVFDQAKIDELAASIREKGILQPIIVSRKGDRYEIVSGERRFRAAMTVGLKEVPAILRDVASAESLEIALIENIQREDLNPIEEATAYQELIDRFSCSQEEVAKKVGKDRATVANLLRLLKLPTKIREFVEKGALSVGHARPLLTVEEIERQLILAAQAVEEGWSVREMERRASVHRKGPRVSTHSRMPISPAIARLMDDLRRRLGTQVRIVPSGKRGKIVIEYYSEMDLDRLYQQIVK